MQDKEHKILLSQKEWAEIHGISRQHVNNLIRDGKIPNVNGKIDQEEADKAYEEMKALRSPGKRDSVDRQRITEAFNVIKIRQEALKCKELERKDKAASGQYLEGDKVERFLSEAISILQNGLSNLQQRLAPKLVTMNDEHEISKLLGTEHSRLLQDFKDATNKIYI